MAQGFLVSVQLREQGADLHVDLHFVLQLFQFCFRGARKLGK